MNLNLKSIVYDTSNSIGSNAFVANLCIGSKKIAALKNEGKGGYTQIEAYPGFENRLESAFEYTKTLPMVAGYEMDLEFWINIKIEEFILGRIQSDRVSQLEKIMKHSVVYRTINGDVTHIEFKRFSINEMLGTESGRTTIRTLVDKLKEEGSTIINTNIDIILK